MDGEEVQPGATVKVSVSLNDEKKIKDADVYHVDENDNVENMDGSVARMVMLSSRLRIFLLM